MRTRGHRAHIDEKTSFHAAGQQPVGAEVDALDRSVVEKEGNHDFRIVHQLAERRGPSRSRLACVVRVGDSAIPNPHFMANLEQPPAYRGAHPSCSRNSDIHVTSLCLVPCPADDEAVKCRPNSRED